MRFVLDASTAIRWCLTVQQTSSSIAVLELMLTSEVYVPTIWPAEVASVISREVNKQNITLDDADEFFMTLDEFNISVNNKVDNPARVFDAARRHRLTGYDATYIELAIALGLPLVSEDNNMLAAAKRAGVALVV